MWWVLAASAIGAGPRATHAHDGAIVRTSEGVFAVVPREARLYTYEEYRDSAELLTTQLHHPGRVEIIADRRGPLKAGELAKIVWPATIPVTTVFKDGSTSQGCWLENITDESVKGWSGSSPDYIYWTGDGSWHADPGGATIMYDCAGPCPGDPPGYRYRTDREGHRLQVHYRDMRVRQVQPRATFALVYNIPSQTPTGIPRESVVAVAARVAARCERAMEAGQRSGVVIIDLAFAPLDPPPNGKLASTDQLFASYAVSGLNQQYLLQVELDQEPDAGPVAANYPQGFGLSCRWNSGFSDAIGVRFPRSLARHLDLRHQTDLLDATITVNTLYSWDFEGDDGTPLLKHDFEAMLTHETLHALGFDSMVDIGQQQRVEVTALDVFRFDSPQVSLTTFQTGTRNMVGNNTNLPAWYTFLLGTATDSFQGSRGGLVDYGAAHWRSREFLGGFPIGVMDPKDSPGEFPDFDDYANNVDWGALDIIGWNINRPLSRVVPFSPSLTQPTASATLVPKNATLVWSPLASGETASVFVHEGTAITATSERFRATGLTGSTVTVPFGNLQGGRTYLWWVTAVNADGFAVSARRTFSTKCDADVDDGSGTGTPDGGVTIDDLLFFTASFNAGDVRADVDDGSGTGIPDGGVTIDDLLYFLTRLDAGC